MIKVEEIEIQEFRGIRKLKLKPSGENFAICGPNGTGKSGVVDAIEFALTGNISRLSGKGTGDISVKEHGPHVDSSKKPENAIVSLKIEIPSLGKKVTITRAVKTAKTLTVTPDSTDVREILDKVQAHPEFALSRREIIQYILTEPGSRAKDVQALLRLDEIETLRATLQKISNSTKKDQASAKQSKIDAGNELARVLTISQVSEENILKAANEKRKLLNLPEIVKLDSKTSLKDGLAESAENTGKLVKKIATDDSVAAQATIKELRGKDFKKLCANVKDEISALLKKGPQASSKEELLQSALEQFDNKLCPVCGTPWDADEFKTLIKAKLKAFEEISKQRKSISKQLEVITLRVDEYVTPWRSVFPHALKLKPAFKFDALGKFGKSAKEAKDILSKADISKEMLDALDVLMGVPEAVVKEFEKFDLEVGKLPDATKEDAAKEYLIAAQERLDAYRQAAIVNKRADEKAIKAAKILDIYGAETTKALEKIYDDVNKHFVELYRAVNEDEKKFDAKLEPSIGKLAFDVDFYGRGFFPPGAYHSEGHQDGMGLCLYLALMNHLLGDNFTFAVLDDVLMSVDTGHRREVSKMLRKYFPNTQFILTTHDYIWLKHMKTAGLIQAKSGSNIHFRKWSVDTGPADWDDRDIWKEIQDYLDKNDVRAAAGLLRHYLEHISLELCDSLRARVEFRGDAQFSLGDLLPNAISAFKDYIKAGKASAHSWGKTQDFTDLGNLEADYQSAVAVSNAENWQVNAAVHYNEWQNLSKTDFEAVVKAYNELLKFFGCNTCSSIVYATPEYGTAELVRCACGDTTINLVKKQKEKAA